MAVKQISIFVENKEGRIKKAIDTLAKQNINIRALSIADTTKYGILRLIVSDNEKAIEALENDGYNIKKTEDGKEYYLAQKIREQNSYTKTDESKTTTNTMKKPDFTVGGMTSSKKMRLGKVHKRKSDTKTFDSDEINLKDIYVNEEVLPGKISYTINFVVTPKDRTLEASDIEKFSSRLIEHVKRIGVELRG